jgi:hypothetical protein
MVKSGYVGTLWLSEEPEDRIEPVEPVVKELALQKVKDGLVIINIEERLPWYAFDAELVGGCRYLKSMWSDSRRRKATRSIY